MINYKKNSCKNHIHIVQYIKPFESIDFRRKNNNKQRILLLSCGVLVLCDGAPRTMSGGEPSSIKRYARATQFACTPYDRGKIFFVR